MLKNYFTIAIRNLWKNKTFTIINVLGLAFGMACSLLIILWVKDERSVDTFHKNKNQLYRIYMREFFSGKQQAVIWTPEPLAEELKKVIPEIKYSTAFSWPSNQTFAAGDKINKQETNAAGADFFKMFSFKLLEGTPEAALKDVNSLAISRKMAEMFFGNPEKAIGKTIRIDNREDLKITAVFENIPVNSTLKFDCLQSWVGYLKDNPWAKEWDNTDPLTFFMISPEANSKIVEAKIKNVLDKYKKGLNKTELAMQPFHEYYLNSNFKETKIDGGRIEYVRLFSIVAVFILLIACVNFMNLSTARSAKRAKEVGVRKVIGAKRSALIWQFIGEAMLLTIISVIFSLLLVILLLPLFNTLTSKRIDLPITDITFWCFLFSLTFITGLIAGSYPAFFLSSLAPVKILKGTLKFNSTSIWLRQGLVVFQFSLAILLIIGMMFISRQVDFIQSKNLGFNHENLIYFPLDGDLKTTYSVLQEEISRIPSIIQQSRMTANPASINDGTEGISWKESDPNAKIRFTPVGIGYDFVKTMGLELTEGRDYSKNFSSDSTKFLINETAAKIMVFAHPIGQNIKWGNVNGTIIGIVKDFHFQSLHTPIRPLIAYLKNIGDGNAIVRIQAGKTNEAISQLEKVCKKLNPNFPFTYYFTDEEYAKQYRNEQVVSKLSSCFAFLAIFISCLGLFGLANFIAEQRTKEVGIRKVLGASIFQVFTLLSKDFLHLVLIAFLIAAPLAWYIMNQWLQNFAYKIEISWWIFVIAGILSLLIALLTVSLQAIKVAIANPVESLRSE